MSKRRMVTCCNCGEKFDYEEEGRYWQKAYWCEECSRELEFECCKCANYMDTEDEAGLPIQHCFLVVFNAQEVGPRQGIYEITSWPYFVTPTIGRGNIYPESVKRLMSLPFPAPSHYAYPTGHLCEDCQTKLGLDRTKTGAYKQQKGIAK